MNQRSLNQDLTDMDQVMGMRQGGQKSQNPFAQNSVTFHSQVHQNRQSQQLSGQASQQMSFSQHRGSHGSNSGGVQDLNINLTDEKMANIKSPMYLRLQKMIETLGVYRSEMETQKLPRFEANYVARKKQEAEIRKREKLRLERMNRQSKRVDQNSDQYYSIVNGVYKRRNNNSQGGQMGKKMSRKETFNSYKINDYKIERPPIIPKSSMKTARVKFGQDVSSHNLGRGLSSHLVKQKVSSVASQRSSHLRTNESQRDDNRSKNGHVESKDTILSLESPPSSPKRNSRRHSLGGKVELNFGSIAAQTSVEKRLTASIEGSVDEEPVSLNEDSSSDDSSEGRFKIKRRPGETKEQAIARVKKQREIRRIEEFLRFAYPRQREAYIYKKKMLSPQDMNMSVDLFKLKKESMRIDQERNMATSQTKSNNYSFLNQSKMFMQLESGQFSYQKNKPTHQNSIDAPSQVDKGGARVMTVEDGTLNSVSTLPGKIGNQEMVLAESSVNTGSYQNSVSKDTIPGANQNLKSEDSLLEAMPNERLDDQLNLFQEPFYEQRAREQVHPISIKNSNMAFEENLAGESMAIHEASRDAEATPAKPTSPAKLSKVPSKSLQPPKTANVKSNLLNSQPKTKFQMTWAAQFRVNMNRKRNTFEPNMSTSSSPPPEIKNKQKVFKRKQLIIQDAFKMQSNISSVLQNFQDSLNSSYKSGSANRVLSPTTPISVAGLQVSTNAPYVKVEQTKEAGVTLPDKFRTIVNSPDSTLFMPRIGANANIRVPQTGLKTPTLNQGRDRSKFTPRASVLSQNRGQSMNTRHPHIKTAAESENDPSKLTSIFDQDNQQIELKSLNKDGEVRDSRNLDNYEDRSRQMTAITTTNDHSNGLGATTTHYSKRHSGGNHYTSLFQPQVQTSKNRDRNRKQKLPAIQKSQTQSLQRRPVKYRASGESTNARQVAPKAAKNLFAGQDMLPSQWRVSKERGSQPKTVKNASPGRLNMKVMK